MRDWGDPAGKPRRANGVKARVGEEDDTPRGRYSDWHRTLPRECYMVDVDSVEWRSGPAGPQIVAVLELTFYDDIPEWRWKLPWYCASAIARFERDGQNTVARLVGERFGVPVYLVVARKDLAVFHVCRLRDHIWREMSEPVYRRWLESLRPPPRLEDEDLPPE